MLALLRRLCCRLLGHRYPLEATWRWVHRPNAEGYGRPLGARARRRERYRSQHCQRCRARKAQASDAVARPASSKAGLSIRVATGTRGHEGAISPGSTRKSGASVSSAEPPSHHLCGSTSGAPASRG
jgi:hypothetical protein